MVSQSGFEHQNGKSLMEKPTRKAHSLLQETPGSFCNLVFEEARTPRGWLRGLYFLCQSLLLLTIGLTCIIAQIIKTITHISVQIAFVQIC